MEWIFFSSLSWKVHDVAPLYILIQILGRKRKSNLKSIKSKNVSSCYGKNWKLITIYVIIKTVIIEIVVKMIVIKRIQRIKWIKWIKRIINKNIGDIKKRTLNQSKSACPSILNFKRLDIYTHKNEHINLNKLIVKKFRKLKLSQISFIIDCLTLI